ncbi:stage II sporulation protein M [Bacillus horti]|uniref:Stage II sporulation protein M n=1 Tax=Caldalkalibacillus horti TaxID=77523 RepID=A0ABT9VUG7_9BACI|nr:stage II sporulation protein M [Bacillus horti]MDQ0164524.1 stage II sporulation protein M [Bacillus horti]
MRFKIGQVMNQHVQDHSSLYLFVVILFVMGVIFGTLTVQSLGYNQQADLFYYFEQFMNQLRSDHFFDSQHALGQNFFNHLKYMGFIWILGLSIIGLPIILVLLFLKGVFIGFTVGFFIHQMGLKGLLFSVVTIVPQNLILVPALLFISVLSISFSLKLIAHLVAQQRIRQRPSFIKYTSVMLALSIVLFLVALFETYFSPTVMKMVG